ncbi:ArsR family transcriptional regulator [Caproicibacterium sp. NSD3]
MRGGEKCACILLEQLDSGQSGLSYHMKILAESGIVESQQKRQRLRWYSTERIDDTERSYRKAYRAFLITIAAMEILTLITAQPVLRL